VTGWPVARLCQIAAVEREQALPDPGADAVDGTAAVEFEVELTFAGSGPRRTGVTGAVAVAGQGVSVAVCCSPTGPVGTSA
jgi:hypothetical protein